MSAETKPSRAYANYVLGLLFVVYVFNMIYRNILNGGGKPSDLDLLERLFVNIEGRTICALADAAVWPLRSIVRKFRHEFLAKMPGHEGANASSTAAVGAK